VPKSDIKQVLLNIDNTLNDDGLFYMGVYGGKDSEHEHVNDLLDIPRFFSFYTESNLKNELSGIFEIIRFNQVNVERDLCFQSALMRKINK
jgi:hypothetical protein